MCEVQAVGLSMQCVRRISTAPIESRRIPHRKAQASSGLKDLRSKQFLRELTLTWASYLCCLLQSLKKSIVHEIMRRSDLGLIGITTVLYLCNIKSPILTKTKVQRVHDMWRNTFRMFSKDFSSARYLRATSCTSTSLGNSGPGWQAMDSETSTTNPLFLLPCPCTSLAEKVRITSFVSLNENEEHGLRHFL